MIMSQALTFWKKCLIFLDHVLTFSRHLWWTFESHRTGLTCLSDANLKRRPENVNLRLEKRATLATYFLDKALRPIMIKWNWYKLTQFQSQAQSYAVAWELLDITENSSRIMLLSFDLLMPYWTKSTKFEWTDEYQNSFQTLRKTFISPPVLAFPDVNEQFAISADASGSAIRQGLEPKGSNGQMIAIAYSGRSLHGHTLNWIVSQQEC